MRPRWCPVWLWLAVVYRPVLVRSVRLFTDTVILPDGPLRGVVLRRVCVEIEDWRGRCRTVISEPAGGFINHGVTAVGLRRGERRADPRRGETQRGGDE